MCGIAGIIDTQLTLSAETLQTDVSRMIRSLRHRGPDHEGTWIDRNLGLALGHRRLSIIDLSQDGWQPMGSPSGRYITVFNGEIYNHRELRRELVKLGTKFAGTCDTEVMLAAMDQWGFERTLKMLNGMFAFGLLDREGQTFHLVRDRIGEKPLYYTWVRPGVFLFASEVRSLRCNSCFSAPIERDGLAAFLRYGYVPAPMSIYEGVKKLTPGTSLTLSIDSRAARETIKPYWSLLDLLSSDHGAMDAQDETELVNQTEHLLKASINLRMFADVPVGVFLSGGIDSSTIAAMLQTLSSRPIKTFTMGFVDTRYDEAPHAREIANYVGAEHHEMYFSDTDLTGTVPLLASIYDEPFADSSAIPTSLLARFAREHVAVVLSGDGGDELFGGYDRYTWAQIFSKWASRMPWQVRKLLPAIVRIFPKRAVDYAGAALFHRSTAPLLLSNMGKVAWAADIISGVDDIDRYHRLVKGPGQALIPETVDRVPTAYSDVRTFLCNRGFTEQMMYIDSLTYLPDDILVKVDRATMAVALEARVPLLDPVLIEFLWSTRRHRQVQPHSGKWILKAVLGKYIPECLTDRPKSGFGVPLARWLRGPLQAWAGDLIETSKGATNGYLQKRLVDALWAEHLSGQADHSSALWRLLMFQGWLQHNTSIPEAC
jgi:asparagine synthase (glutamine-hydrolysing)